MLCRPAAGDEPRRSTNHKSPDAPRRLEEIEGTKSLLQRIQSEPMNHRQLQETRTARLGRTTRPTDHEGSKESKARNLFSKNLPDSLQTRSGRRATTVDEPQKTRRTTKTRRNRRHESLLQRFRSKALADRRQPMNRDEPRRSVPPQKPEPPRRLEEIEGTKSLFQRIQSAPAGFSATPATGDVPRRSTKHKRREAPRRLEGFDTNLFSGGAIDSLPANTNAQRIRKTKSAFKARSKSE